jgi:lambda family phage minor tail protein L
MADSTQKTLIEAELLSPTALVIMYILDASSIGGDVLRYHNGAISTGNIQWQGYTYTRFPVEADGYDILTQSLPRPKVRFSNMFGGFTALNDEFNDLIGAKVIRKRVFYRHLDGQPEADPQAGYPDDIFYIHQCTTENKLLVEYELATPLERLENIQLPKRQVFSNLCIWKYRSAECEYIGPPVAQRDGTAIIVTNDRGQWSPFAEYSIGDYCFKYLEGVRKQYYVAKQSPVAGIDKEPPNSTYWIVDECSKRLSDGCEQRFGKGAPGEKADGSFPFGGFPGSRLIGSG